jgi:hypothetical protein
MDVKIKGFFTKKTDKYKLLEKNVGNTTHNTFLPFRHSFAQSRVSRKQAVGAAVIIATSRDVAPILSPIMGAKNTTNPLKIPKNMPDLTS